MRLLVQYDDPSPAAAGLVEPVEVADVEGVEVVAFVGFAEIHFGHSVPPYYLRLACVCSFCFYHVFS